MEGIAKATGVICIAVMAMGILYELGNFQATEKVMRFVIAIYIIATAFGALKDTRIYYDTEGLSENAIKQNNTDVLKQEIISQTEKELTALVKKRLDEKNISYNQVALHILEQNGSIVVDSVYIDCRKEDAVSAKQCVQDIIDEDTQIVTGD